MSLNYQNGEKEIMSSFTKPFNVLVHNVPLKQKPFEVAEEFEFYSKEKKGLTVTVPVGYRSNFASVPRMFWNYLPPVGRYSKACVVHDWLIDSKESNDLTIREINEIFFECMSVLKVNVIFKYVMYGAVELYWEIFYPIKRSIMKLFGD